MTDDDVWTSAINWVRSIVGGTVIRSYEDGPRPPVPYVMVNMPTVNHVRELPMDFEYTPDRADEPPPSGSPPVPVKITVAPVFETEWHFSVHAYGPNPSDQLRKVPAARHVPQMMENIRPLNVFDTSHIRRVPEWVNEKWEPRANIDLFLRGLTRDGFVIDTIDDIEPFILTREGTD